MYGQVWRSQFKNDDFLVFVKSEWQEGLRRYTDAIIDLAIEVCREQKEFPPTLPQFIVFCKNCAKRLVPEEPTERSKPVNPEVAIRNLSKMKAILNMK